MRRDGGRSARHLLSALLLGLGGAALAWLCVRTALVRALPPTAPLVARLAPHDPDVALGVANAAFVRRRGEADPATLGDVLDAAAAAPLDARPYLIVGQRQLADQPRRAVSTLEAGQRLNPRQRAIHALLLEHYFRTREYGKAAAQFSVMARLLSETREPIAKAVALMSTAPETRDAVRRTLSTDPALETAVLTMLARGDAAPAGIFDLASPTAKAKAGGKASWGPALVARLVRTGRYGEARAAWRRIYGLPDAQADAPIFNAGFRSLPASPPFNWTLAAGAIGTADPRDGGLAVDYHGRGDGDLASQLLLLRPGRYRFSFVVEGGRTGMASNLGWRVTCVPGKAVRMTAAIAPAGEPHRTATEFVVPPDCPAQALTLRAEAGELPVPVSVTVRDLSLDAAAGDRP